MADFGPAQRDASLGLSRSSHFAARSPISVRSAITVDGDRGSGKTTVLVAAMSSLLEEDSLAVIPITRPEMFGDGDSLFGSIIELLAEYVSELHPDVYRASLSDEGPTVAAEFDRIARLEAASRRGTWSPKQSEDIAEATVDALTKTRRSSEFDIEWRPFVSRILEAVGASQLIVPIDDADLVPENLPALLTDLRRLSEHDSIVSVVALNSEDLHDFLKGDILGSSGLTPDQFPRSELVVRRQIEKALPLQNWVRLRPWGPEQRLHFRPVGSVGPELVDLLAGVTFGNASIDSLLTFSDGTPSHFASALGTRPRALETLYAELSRRSVGDRREALLFSVKEHIEDEIRGLPLKVVQPLNWTRLGNEFSVDLDLSEWGFFAAMSSNESKSLRSQVQLGSSKQWIDFKFHRYRGDGARVKGRFDEPGSQPEFSDDAVFSALLVLDLASRRGFRKFRVKGGIPSRGGRGWRRPSVKIGDAPTDDRFLSPPSWDGWMEHLRLATFLNEVHDQIEDDSDRYTKKSVAAFIEWYALAQLHLVAVLQKHPLRQPKGRGLAAELLSSSEASKVLDGSPTWTLKRKKVAASVIRSLVSEYRSSLPMLRSDDRAKDFVSWFEGDLLLALHPAILSHEVSSMFETTWLNAVTGANRVTQAKISARDCLLERLTKAGSELWGRPVSELGERLGLGPEFQREGDAGASLVDDSGQEKSGKSIEPAPISRRDSSEIQKVARSSALEVLDSVEPSSRVDVERAFVAALISLIDELGSDGELANVGRSAR